MHLLVIKHHPALGGREESGNNVEQGRFTAARRAEDRHDFAGFYFQVYILQRLDMGSVRQVKTHGQVFDGQRRNS